MAGWQGSGSSRADKRHGGGGAPSTILSKAGQPHPLSNLAAAEYSEAAPSVLVGETPRLLSKLNGKHAADIARFASVFSGVEEGEASASEVVSLDQLGFDLRVRGVAEEGEGSVVRVGLKVPPQTAAEATSAVTKLFQEAYAKQQGW